MTPPCERCGVIHPLAYWVERSWLCFDCHRRYGASRRGGRPAGASARGEPRSADVLEDGAGRSASARKASTRSLNASASSNRTQWPAFGTSRTSQLGIALEAVQRLVGRMWPTA